MISVAEAQAAVLALATPPQAEPVPLRHAAGRWMLAHATALADQPPFDASAMDGYAVAGEAPPGACFSVVGEAAAGRAYPGALAPGQAIRIFTGAPVPPGATRVVIQEDVARTGDTITVGRTPDAGLHIRARGQDFARGATLGPRRLRPADLALLASMNVATVQAARAPTVALIATGDELVAPGEVPGPGQIVASNTYALAAMVAAAGGLPRILPIARDTPEALTNVFTLATGCDVIVTTGGASVGDHDLVAGVAQAQGLALAFHRIAMRPGKPLMAGRMGGSVLLGLPGNPVSSVVCGHLFMLPLLRALQGDPAPLPIPRRAILASDVGPTGPRAHYMRATLTQGAGLPHITPAPRQDSALLGVLAGADALLIRPLGDGARATGETVDYLPI